MFKAGLVASLFLSLFSTQAIAIEKMAVGQSKIVCVTHNEDQDAFDTINGALASGDFSKLGIEQKGVFSASAIVEVGAIPWRKFCVTVTLVKPDADQLSETE